MSKYTRYLMSCCLFEIAKNMYLRCLREQLGPSTSLRCHTFSIGLSNFSLPHRFRPCPLLQGWWGKILCGFFVQVFKGIDSSLLLPQSVSHLRSNLSVEENRVPNLSLNFLLFYPSLFFLKGLGLEVFTIDVPSILCVLRVTVSPTLIT